MQLREEGQPPSLGKPNQPPDGTPSRFFPTSLAALTPFVVHFLNTLNAHLDLAPSALFYTVSKP